MLTKEQSLDFYKNNLPVLPHDSKFRQYRLKLFDGKWCKIRSQITSPRQLQKYLIKYAPQEVYVSSSCFLNSKVVGPKRWNKAGYKVASNMFLFSDFVVDFDKKQFNNDWTLTLNEVKKVADYFALYNKLYVRTGNGFQMWLLDWDSKVRPTKAMMPLEKENHYKQLKRNLVYKLSQAGFVFDCEISYDTRRVVRCWNTLHRNGTVCVPSFSLSQLENSLVRELNEFAKIDQTNGGITHSDDQSVVGGQQLK
jgi:DNA primase catalytic subunit